MTASKRNQESFGIMREHKSIKVRMCVQCRIRFDQNVLIRLQIAHKRITPFSGMGRSFYVCRTCAPSESFTRHMLGRCKIPKEQIETFKEELKDIITNG